MFTNREYKSVQKWAYRIWNRWRWFICQIVYVQTCTLLLHSCYGCCFLLMGHHATHIRCFEFRIARLLCIMYVYFKLPLEFMVSFSIYILFTFSFEAVNRISLFICLLTGVQFAGLGVLRKRTGCTLITMMSCWIYSTGWEYRTPGTSI